MKVVVRLKKELAKATAEKRDSLAYLQKSEEQLEIPKIGTRKN